MILFLIQIIQTAYIIKRYAKLDTRVFSISKFYKKKEKYIPNIIHEFNKIPVLAKVFKHYTDIKTIDEESLKNLFKEI